jgi:aryl-alcohol dehydrogenase-like predicted oxidoreductase
VDILFLHSCAETHLRSEELFERLESLKAAGKIRAYGASTDPQVLSAVERHLDVVQFPFADSSPIALHLAARSRRAGTAVIANQPFHRGHALRNEDLPAHAAIPMGHEQPVAAPLSRKAITEFMLNKPLRDGADIVLCSMIRPEHIRANVEAVSATSLTEADYLSLENLAGDQF